MPHGKRQPIEWFLSLFFNLRCHPCAFASLPDAIIRRAVMSRRVVPPSRSIVRVEPLSAVGERFSRLPPHAHAGSTTAPDCVLLLRHPWKLDTASANYLVIAGIGYTLESVPPLPTMSAPGDR
jgi:hypothetical protein